MEGNGRNSLCFTSKADKSDCCFFFYCPVNQLATTGGFPLFQRATLDARFNKTPAKVGSKQNFPLGKVFSVCFVLLCSSFKAKNPIQFLIKEPLATLITSARLAVASRLSFFLLYFWAAGCSTCFLSFSPLKPTENIFCWNLERWIREISEVKFYRSSCQVRG